METKAGDPGAFAQFDLNRVSSPAFVVDAAKLRANLQILADIRDAADVKVLAALKAFSMLGESSLAKPITTTSDNIIKPKATQAWGLLGGAGWLPSALTSAVCKK